MNHTEMLYMYSLITEGTSCCMLYVYELNKQRWLVHLMWHYIMETTEDALKPSSTRTSVDNNDENENGRFVKAVSIWYGEKQMNSNLLTNIKERTENFFFFLLIKRKTTFYNEQNTDCLKLYVWSGLSFYHLFLFHFIINTTVVYKINHVSLIGY